MNTRAEVLLFLCSTRDRDPIATVWRTYAAPGGERHRDACCFRARARGWNVGQTEDFVVRAFIDTRNDRQYDLVENYIEQMGT